MRRFWIGFFAVGCSIAGLGFAYKLYEFFFDVAGREGFEFAGTHLVTYALVACGFLLLLLYALLQGHFADIERPKHELLERELRYDRAQFGTDSCSRR
jgi:hypothetical protein